MIPKRDCNRILTSRWRETEGFVSATYPEERSDVRISVPISSLKEDPYAPQGLRIRRRSVSLQRLTIIALSITFLALSGCGKKQNPQRTDIVHQSRGNIPKKYQIEDSDCNINQGSLEAFSIYIWEQDGPKAISVDLSYLASKDGKLHGRVLEGISHSAHYHWMNGACSIFGDPNTTSGLNISCNEKLEEIATIAPPQPLNLCSYGSGSYSKDSIEGISLSAIYHLEEAYSFYQKLPYQDIREIKKTRLEILPTVEMVMKLTYSDEIPQHLKDRVYQKFGKKLVQTITNNSIYLRSNGSGSFLVLPDSTESHNLYGNLKMWHSDFIMKHEFGHHIFHTHTAYPIRGHNKNKGYSNLNIHTPPGSNLKKKLSRLLNEIEDEGISDTSALYQLLSDGPVVPRPGKSSAATPHQQGSNQTLRTSQGQLVIRAFDEAFADLFSYYANGQESNYTQNMGCIFEDNRDVTKGRFNRHSDQIEKRLSSTILRQYLSREEAQNENPCKINFTDEHIIGAIIAYALDTLFTNYLEGQNGKLESQAKASLLLGWLDSLSQLSDYRLNYGMATGFKLIQLAFEAAFITMDKDRRLRDNSGLLEQQCQALEDIIPVLKTKDSDTTTSQLMIYRHCFIDN